MLCVNKLSVLKSRWERRRLGVRHQDPEEGVLNRRHLDGAWKSAWDSGSDGQEEKCRVWECIQIGMQLGEEKQDLLFLSFLPYRDEKTIDPFSLSWTAHP